MSTRGNPGTGRAAASSSSFTFLEVLLGTRRIGVLGARWNSPEGAAVPNHLRFRRSAFVGVFSFFPFLFGFFWAYRVLFAPAVVSLCIGWLLY